MSGSPPRGNTAVRCGGGRGARGKSPCCPSGWRRREGSRGSWGMHTELERGPRRIRSVIAGLLWGCTVRRSRRRNRHGGPRDVKGRLLGSWSGSVLESAARAESSANVRQKLNWVSVSHVFGCIARSNTETFSHAWTEVEFKRLTDLRSVQ